MQYQSENDLAAAAASKAIYKSIKDVESLLDGVPLKSAGTLRTKLREVLVTGFNDVGRLWYKRGFNRGIEKHTKSSTELVKYQKNSPPKCAESS